MKEEQLDLSRRYHWSRLHTALWSHKGCVLESDPQVKSVIRALSALLSTVYATPPASADNSVIQAALQIRHTS